MTFLNRTAVFIDFDGTITVQDTSEYLLERLADGHWWEPGLHYRAGQISSRECLEREWALLPHDEATLLTTASEVPLDPDFPPLIMELGKLGATITVLSDGYGVYVADVCRPLGVNAMTARIEGDLLTFPHAGTWCRCAGCGTCKVEPIVQAQRQGLTTVVIGDGTSDRRAAMVADRVLAKHELAAWCTANAVPHVQINSLADVRQHFAEQSAWRCG